MAHVGEIRGAYRVLVGKPEGKRPLGRPNSRNRMAGGDRTDRVPDRGLMAGSCEHDNAPPGSIKCGKFLD